MGNRPEYMASALRICVDEVIDGDKDIKGRICGVAVKEDTEFHGSSELFILIDRLLDGIGKPQPSRKSRMFRNVAENDVTSYCVSPEIYHSSDEIREKEGRLFTRDVLFVSRLRSSWQGVMKDADGRLLGNFDSDLEFIGLLYDRRVTR
nr:hypothetical protein [uncultured Blautia sp.]